MLKMNIEGKSKKENNKKVKYMSLNPKIIIIRSKELNRYMFF